MEAHAGKPDRFEVRISAGGRVVIPAALRLDLGIEVGDLLQLRVREGVLIAHTVGTGLRRARALLEQMGAPIEGMVDEFLDERRSAAAQEVAGE